MQVGGTLGRYRILEQIGAGGMGVVFRAYDQRLEREIALKVLPPGTLADEQTRKRFRNEALALSRLNHPNVAIVHDFDAHEGLDFLATEYIAGQSLDRVLASGPLPEKEVIRLALQLCDGLAAAHEQGVIHRDLKPANLRLTPDGRLKILDFGLAKVTAEGGGEATVTFTDSSVVTGTLPYMAPEQLRAQPADARTDVWAVGVVLYEMVTGRRPFRGNTAFELSSAILNDPLPAVPATCTPDLQAIIQRCLAREPAQRYQRAGEVRAVLEMLQTSAVTARLSTAPARGWNRRLGWGVAALAVAATMVAAFWLPRPAQAPPAAWSLKPLTSFAGMEWGASWSPDGNFIAYAHTKPDAMNIFVRAVAGGDPVQLTDTPYDELVARWSPDGRYIAFTSDRGQGTDVYVIPPLGGAERKIAETHVPWLEQGIVALSVLGAVPWSPNGEELILSRLSPGLAVALWKVNLRSGSETQLTRPGPGIIDLSATWSFDGKTIAFTRMQQGRSELWLLPAANGEATLLLADAQPSVQPAWTPDNRRLVFISYRAGAGNLWDIDVNSKQLRQITTSTGGDILPVVSSGGRVAFTSYNHQLPLHWGVLDKPDAEHPRLTSQTHNNFGARVSPDGKQVLYYSDRTGNYELWLLDRATGNERQLTDDPASDYLADWSPDGRAIVFTSTRGGSSRLWVLDVASGRTRKLTDTGPAPGFEPHFSNPRWSPDGKAVGFVGGGPQGGLWVVEPDGANLHSALAGVLGFDWYRDSHHIVYTARNESSGEVEMRAMDLDTGEHAVLLRAPLAELAVARDGRAVAYVHAASHFNMQLHVLRLEPGVVLPRVAGPPRRITNGDGAWHVHNGGWSPDGKAIVYTRDTDNGDIYMIENYH